jgi:hypothetical protein
MPTDEVPPLPEDKIDRILQSALNVQRVVARNPGKFSRGARLEETIKRASASSFFPPPTV